jgi:hypothetical protein
MVFAHLLSFKKKSPILSCSQPSHVLLQALELFAFPWSSVASSYSQNLTPDSSFASNTVCDIISSRPSKCEAFRRSLEFGFCSLFSFSESEVALLLGAHRCFFTGRSPLFLALGLSNLNTPSLVSMFSF